MSDASFRGLAKTPTPLTTDDALLLRLAERHSLAPLLYHFLKRTGAPIPETLEPPLRAAAHAAAQNSLRHTAALFRVLDALAPLDCLVFKGPVLAWGFYESPGLRSMSDIDILIRRESIDAARTRLESIGYRTTFGTADLKFYRYEIGFEHPDGTHIDLHWHLAPLQMDRWFDLDQVWRNTTELLIAGRVVRTLGSTDHIRYLTAHAAKHGFNSLRDLADIARVVTRSAIDWPRVLAEAAHTRSTRPLYVGLTLTTELIGAAVPRLPPDRNVSVLAATARQRLLSADPLPHRGPAALATLPYLERTSDKLRLLDTLRPGVCDRTALALPRLLHPLYYLIRPVRLACKYAPRFAKRTPPAG